MISYRLYQLEQLARSQASPAEPETLGTGRRVLRRQQTIEEALDAAVAIMEEAGVGGQDGRRATGESQTERNFPCGTLGRLALAGGRDERGAGFTRR
jgi:hypothetical protein